MRSGRMESLHSPAAHRLRGNATILETATYCDQARHAASTWARRAPPPARDVRTREGRNLLRPNLSEKNLPFLYTLHFNGHEIICRQNNLAASVES